MKFKEKEERKSKKQLAVFFPVSLATIQKPAFGLGCSTDRSGGAKAPGAATGGEGAVVGAAGAAWWGARFDGEGAF